MGRRVGRFPVHPELYIRARAVPGGQELYLEGKNCTWGERAVPGVKELYLEESTWDTKEYLCWGGGLRLGVPGASNKLHLHTDCVPGGKWNTSRWVARSTGQHEMLRILGQHRTKLLGGRHVGRRRLVLWSNTTHFC